MNIFNPSKNNLDEIVFENRNKMYGAYALRKDAAKYTNLGMTYALSPFILLSLFALVYGKTHSSNTTPTLTALKSDTKKNNRNCGDQNREPSNCARYII